MKKLRFFLMASLFVVFTTGLVSAQGNKTQDCQSWEGAFVAPCMDEAAYGTTEFCLTSWNDKLQFKLKGEWVGESGKIYTFSIVENANWKNYVYGKAYNYSAVANGSVECDGVPIAALKVKIKLTANAKGEIVVDRYEYDDWTCL